MRRHLALAVAAMLIVLSSSTHSDAEQRKQPGTGTITSDQKALCDWYLNHCVADCYATLGTASSRTCTTNCTIVYRRCKRTGHL